MKKHVNLYLVAILSLFMASCEKYDDSELKDRVGSIENRVNQLEQQLQTINGNIQTMSGLIQALQNNLYIKEVKKIANGHVITFSDNSTITIHDGVDGRDGKDAPIISTIYSNGKYYWSQIINGVEAYLTDNNGNRIVAEGITPVLKVDSDGYWLISYDKGGAYQTVRDDQGNPVKAIPDSKASFFDDVYVLDNELRLVLKDGSEINIPIGSISYLKAVDLGVSVRWSSLNVGATQPSDVGTHFLWGDADNTGVLTYYQAPNLNNIVSTQYDMARKQMGDQWRMPTKQEQQEIIFNCTWTPVKVNGVEGRRVTGNNGNSIFLPNTGVVFPKSGPIGSTQLAWEDSGYYWVGESYVDGGTRFGYVYHFDSSDYFYNASYNTYAVKIAVRPVRDM